MRSLCVPLAIAACGMNASAQEISVGPNVLVSSSHSKDSHYEVLVAADPAT